VDAVEYLRSGLGRDILWHLSSLGVFVEFYERRDAVGLASDAGGEAAQEGVGGGAVRAHNGMLRARTASNGVGAARPGQPLDVSDEQLARLRALSLYLKDNDLPGQGLCDALIRTARQ
jgi:hypothetical protein